MDIGYMSSEKLLDGIKTRIPWGTLSLLLRTIGIPAKKGKDATIAHLYDYVTSDQGQNKLPALEGIYEEHILYGEKTVRFYKIDDEEYLTDIINVLSGYVLEKNAFSDAYPYTLSDTELNEVDREPKLCAIKSDENITLVFSAKRYISEKVELSTDDFGDSPPEKLQQFDEIVAYRNYDKQFFDVVTIRPQEKLIEVRIDTTISLSNEDLKYAFGQIHHALNALLSTSSIEKIASGSRMNLFPLIGDIYDSAEGRVCELGFITDSASIKHEKMRRKDIDLRGEAYHKAGAEAVDHITPYRIAVTWNYDILPGISSRPELLLPGGFRMLSGSPPTLMHMHIEKCTGQSDYEFVLKKTLSLLSSDG